MSGMAKLNEIDEELKRLNYSPEEEKKPINYRIQVFSTPISMSKNSYCAG
jgi:hypothetical protein